MKTAGFFLFILCFGLNATSQSQQNENIVKLLLHDGSVYIGKVLEYTQREYINFQLNNGHILKIQKSDVKKMKGDDKLLKSKFNLYEFQEKGFYNVSYVSFSGGSSVRGLSSIGVGLSSSFGYMFNRYLGAGFGIGWDRPDFIQLKQNQGFLFNPLLTMNPIANTFPVFLEARGYFYGDRNAYYYSLNAGYAFVDKNKDANVIRASGGFIFYPAIGLRIGGRKHFNLCMDLSFKFQKVDYVLSNFLENGTDHYYQQYKRFIFRIGIQI